MNPAAGAGPALGRGGAEERAVEGVGELKSGLRVGQSSTATLAPPAAMAALAPAFTAAMGLGGGAGAAEGEELTGGEGCGRSSNTHA